MRLTKREEFRKLLYQLSPNDLEELVFDVIQSTDEFQNLERNVILNGTQIDLVAITKPKIKNSKPETWLVEIKRTKLLGTEAILNLVALSNVYKGTNRNAKILIVAAGDMTNQAKAICREYGITFWGLDELSELITSEIGEKYFSGIPLDSKIQSSENNKAEKLSELLTSIKPGKEDWMKYQKYIADVLEFLFCPPLNSPDLEVSDLEKRNRRDIILENSQHNGFWKMIREDYQGLYIVVDAKNYKDPISKRPIIDIAHYLKPYGCGMFAMLFCRMGLGNAAEHAIREQWIGSNKMIICFSDQDVLEMLRIENPEEIIRKKLSDFRKAL